MKKKLPTCEIDTNEIEHGMGPFNKSYSNDRRTCGI